MHTLVLTRRDGIAHRKVASTTPRLPSRPSALSFLISCCLTALLYKKNLKGPLGGVRPRETTPTLVDGVGRDDYGCGENVGVDEKGTDGTGVDARPCSSTSYVKRDSSRVFRGRFCFASHRPSQAVSRGRTSRPPSSTCLKELFQRLVRLVFGILPLLFGYLLLRPEFLAGVHLKPPRANVSRHQPVER